MADKKIKLNITQMIQNSTKMSSTDKRTRGFLDSRMEILQDYWSSYSKSFETLSVSIDAETLQTDYNLVLEENFERTEEYYLELMTWLKDKLYELKEEKYEEASVLFNVRRNNPHNVFFCRHVGKHDQYIFLRRLSYLAVPIGSLRSLASSASYKSSRLCVRLVITSAFTLLSSMDEDEILIMYFFLKRRKMKQAMKRKYWVHPMLMKRIPLGLCQSYIEELKSDDGKFYEYLRMTVTTFDSLLVRLADNLRRENTHFRNCISAEERLVITLRYLASGCSFKQLHYNFRVGMSTISKIIKETCSVIWSVLSAEYLKLPNTEEEWKAIAEAFKTKANFPHCLGALDGKHIRITK
ncbi:unnamed protein product, partial [Leptidea sinapis]